MKTPDSPTTLAQANSREEWDRLWGHPASRDWREAAMKHVYDRILQLVPQGSMVYDFGGGVGHLGARLLRENACHVTIVDFSPIALVQANQKGLNVKQLDLCNPEWPSDFLRTQEPGIIVATEVLEHLNELPLARFMLRCSRMPKETVPMFLFSVPDDRLGPEKCIYHARQWNSSSFKDFLTDRFDSEPRAVSVESISSPNFLLGVVQ